MNNDRIKNMKLLNGAELAGYIKERQARQVRGLIQAHGVTPKLAVVQTKDDPVINSYVALKGRYAADILVELERFVVPQTEARELLERLNSDNLVHGIIIQLPLDDPSETDELVNLVAPEKDVDALGSPEVNTQQSEAVRRPWYDPATALAINWLLAGYNVALESKHIVIVGNGKLVGAPLAKMWRNSGHDVVVLDAKTPEADFLHELRRADIVVSGIGVPGRITADMIAPGAVVVDAGVATEGNTLRGDLDPAIYERDDISITPAKGGVGPLTVCALFDNVIRAARLTTVE